MTEPEYIELNMANYDEDGVAQLNAWGIWAVGEIERLQAAIDRGGWDISPCKVCNEDVVCLPDGLPMCEACAEKEMSE